MRCEGCGASVFEGDAACAECGRELPERAQPPQVVRRHEEAAVEAIAEPEVVVPVEAARCASHTERLSVATCTRCGRFCCPQCVTQPGPLCTDCQRLTRKQNNPLELTRVRREVKVSFFFVFVVVFAIGVVGPLLYAGGRVDPEFLLGGLALSLGLLVCASIFAFTEWRVAAYVAVALEAIAALLLFAVVNGKCLSWPLLAFPIVTLFRLRKWRALQDEAARLG